MLNDEDISDEDYNHAQTLWKEFRMSTFRDYLELHNTRVRPIRVKWPMSDVSIFRQKNSDSDADV